MCFLMLAQYVNEKPRFVTMYGSAGLFMFCFDLSESPDPVVKILQRELARSRGR